MQRRARRDPRRRPLDAAPNLAPLVDVVMVILIFLMLGSAFTVHELGLAAQLPRDVGPDAGPAVSIVPPIRIDLLAGSGSRPYRLAVMGQPIADDSFDSLESLLRSKSRAGVTADSRVVVSAAASVPYRHVIAAMDAATKAGFRNVQFAVDAGAAVGVAPPPPGA
ncbi:MAG: biopolymer transporter ExbD [Phycisphaerae bacterium]